jgi:hypothetical protein
VPVMNQTRDLRVDLLIKNCLMVFSHFELQLHDR